MQSGTEAIRNQGSRAPIITILGGPGSKRPFLTVGFETAACDALRSLSCAGGLAFRTIGSKIDDANGRIWMRLSQKIVPHPQLLLDTISPNNRERTVSRRTTNETLSTCWYSRDLMFEMLDRRVLRSRRKSTHQRCRLICGTSSHR